MTPVDYAILLKDYGPWGMIGLLIGVIVYLHKGWNDCQRIALTDREKLIVTQAASTAATERFEAALNSIRATLETRGQVVADLSSQTEIVATKVQHGFGNVVAAQDALARQIERALDRIQTDSRGRP